MPVVVLIVAVVVALLMAVLILIVRVVMFFFAPDAFQKFLDFLQAFFRADFPSSTL